jgi:hypothetical protein
MTKFRWETLPKPHDRMRPDLQLNKSKGTRPYQALSIEALESMATRCADETATLRAIMAEVSIRSSKRAKRLHQNLTIQLGALVVGSKLSPSLLGRSRFI